MVAPYNIRLGAGITVGSGIGINTTPGGGGGGAGGVDGTIGSSAIPLVTQLQDGTATLNGTTGFTINNFLLTGVAIPYANLTASNLAFLATYGTGSRTVTWGPGSSVASSSVNITQNSSSMLVFFIQGGSGGYTYNFPFTFN